MAHGSKTSKAGPGSGMRPAPTPPPTQNTTALGMAFQRPPGAFSGTCDLSRVDTTQGVGGPMAPPADFTGTPAQYCDLIRERYRLNLAVRQQIQSCARALDHRPNREQTTITGPYADQARGILRAIADQRGKP